MVVPWYCNTRTYTCTYTCTYHGTRVRTYNVMSQISDWKRAHMCNEKHVCFGRIHGSQLREGANAGYHFGTMVRTYVPMVLQYQWYVRTYTCTNITLSQKQLEIQALRCNRDTSGRCQHRRHHGILQLRFQLDSDVCSADLHHNPRKHVGLHAHQRLHRLP